MLVVNRGGSYNDLRTGTEELKSTCYGTDSNNVISLIGNQTISAGLPNNSAGSDQIAI